VIRFLAPQVRAERRTVTLDLAGSGGTLENNAVITLTVRDQHLRQIKTITAVANGVGSSATALLLFTPAALFDGYDGSTDTLGAVLTTTASLTWTSNGVGPRILRYTSDYTQNNDMIAFRNASGTDRLVGANITGAAAGTYVNSGTFDCRSMGGVMTPGATVAGWSDDVPTQGQQLSPAATQERRACSTAGTQTEGGLLSLGTGDVLAVGLGSIVGALTGAISQSASGVTFSLADTDMTVRYLYFHHSKGE